MIGKSGFSMDTFRLRDYQRPGFALSATSCLAFIRHSYISLCYNV